MIILSEEKTIDYQKILLDFINSNKESVMEMLEDNLYVYCYHDSEISIPYKDLPGITDSKQAQKLFPEIISFIESDPKTVERCWKHSFKDELEVEDDIQIDDFDSDKFLDIIYHITETNEFSNYIDTLFDDEIEDIAEYAEEEFDYDIYVKDYIHLTKQNYDGDSYEYINPKVEDYYNDDYYREEY